MVQTFVYGFAGYLAVLAILGVWFHKKSHTASDFILGGRSLNYWTTAIAAHASDMSMWMFMGLPAAAYVTGMQSAWIPLGLMTGMYLTWTFIARPLRVATEHLQSDTLSTYFEKRFNDTTGQLRLVSACFSLWFFTFYIASGLVGMGRLFENTFHIDYHLGILLGLIITVVYTFIGGFAAIAQSHFFQGLFLVIMMLVVPVLAYFSLPPETSFTTLSHLTGISFSLIPQTFSQLVTALVLAISWGMGYFGQPHILINFMGIKDPASMPKAMRVGMLWQFLTFGASLAVGIIGIAFFTTPLTDSMLVFIQTVQILFPPFFAGFLLCAVVAAGLTTIATQMLVSASIISQDLYKHFIHKNASPASVLRVSQYGLMAIPVCSFFIAFSKSTTVMGLVDYAWMGLGASFGPAVIAALYLPRSTQKGIFYGMFAGGLTATLWEPLMGSFMPSMIPAFFLNFLIILVTSQRKSDTTA